MTLLRPKRGVLRSHMRLLLLSLCFVTAVCAENMDHYRGVDNSGRYAATGLLRSWPAEGPKLAWKGAPGAGWCNVAVVDTKVYLVGGHTATLSIYDLDGNLLAKGLAGSAIWKKWTGSRTTPLVHEGVATVGMPNANLVGIDLQTMESRWQINAWKEFGSGKGAMGWGWPESPMRHEDKVIFNACSRDPQTPAVVAINIRDGKKVWELPGRVPTAPSVKDRYSAADVSGACFEHNGRAIVAYPTWMYLVGVDAHTGKLLWDFKAEGEKTITPIYSHGRLLWSPCGPWQMLQLNDDGSQAKLLWTRPGGAGFSGGTIIGDRVYVYGDKNAVPVPGPGEKPAVTEQEGEEAPPPPKTAPKPGATKPEPALLCLAAATGKLIASLPFAGNGHIVSAEGMVYATDVLSNQLRVRLIRPTADGMELAGTLNVPSGANNEGGWHWAIAPVVAEGRLFIRYGDLYVYDLRVEKPAVGWRHDGTGLVEGGRPAVPMSKAMNLRWTATVPGQQIAMTKQHIVVSGGGQVSCLEAATGTLLWSAKTEASSTPVIREDAVFVGGVTRLNLADGKLVWSAKAAGQPLLSENVLVATGEHLAGLDATTGQELWKQPAQPGMPAKLRHDGVGYLVTGWSALVRANDGEVVSRDLPKVARAEVVVHDGVAYLCGDSVAAVRFKEKLWQTPVKATGAGVVQGGKLFVPTAKSLVALQTATGKQVGELVLTSPLTGPVMLVNGNLYLPGATTQVVKATAQLEKVWEFAAKDVALAFHEDRVAVLAGGQLFCFGGPSPGAPKPADGVTIATSAGQLPAGLPVNTLVSDQFIEQWLWAAPIPGFDIKTDLLASLGGREKCLPGLGTKFKVGEQEFSFQLLATNHYWADARFSGGRRTVAFTSVHERKYNTTGYYVTAIENDRDRWVRFATMFPGGSHWRARFDYKAWLSGTPVDETTAYRLPKGRHVLLMQAGMGECESWGQIYMYPRLLDVTEEMEKRLAKHRADSEAWQQFHATEAGKLFVLP